MNAQEIDELNYALNCFFEMEEGLDITEEEAEEMIETVITIFEKYSGIRMIEGSFQERMEIFNAIMSNIEAGDYQYFFNMITNTQTPLIELMKFSSKVDDIKVLIEDREKFGLEAFSVREFIISTGEPDFIKTCVNDRKKFGFSSMDIAELLLGTRDVDFIKDFIQDSENFEFKLNNVSELIDNIYIIDNIKWCIEKREDLGLSSDDIKCLINKIVEMGMDEKYAKDCIKYGQKLGLTSTEIKNLIISFNDEDYIKKCIDELELDIEDVINLIMCTDVEYTKTCINDREKLGIDSANIARLINHIVMKERDIEYAKSCIDNSIGLGLASEDVCALITSVAIFSGNDNNYIKDCINKATELGLSSEGVVNLIFYMEEDVEYIKTCIYDSKRLGLQPEAIKALIRVTEPEFIKKCIVDHEELGLTSDIITELILLTGDLEYIEEQKNNSMNLGLGQDEINKMNIFTQATRINLPHDMTIGVEIETEGTGGDHSRFIEKKLETTKWSVKPDGSLICGTEIVSPILTGESEITSNEIKRTCAILNGVPQKISERCGGHIHIGANYLTSKKDWTNLIKIWSNAEKVLYTISNEAGAIPRNGVPQYASPISKKIEDALERGTINLESEEDLEQFASSISQIQGERYSGINFKNVGTKGKNTIEFRLSNGSLDPNTWIENINLFGGIVKVSHDLSSIQAKPEEQRTNAERRMLECFELIQIEQSDERIVEALIELCIEPEQRHIYMERYRANQPLLENSPEIQEAITKQISINKIGKKVFSGKEPITGETYQAICEQIERDIAEHDIEGMEQEDE